MSYRALPEWRKQKAMLWTRRRKASSPRQLPARVTKSAIRQRRRRTASSSQKNAKCPSERVTANPLNYQTHPWSTRRVRKSNWGENKSPSDPHIGKAKLKSRIHRRTFGFISICSPLAISDNMIPTAPKLQGMLHLSLFRQPKKFINF